MNAAAFLLALLALLAGIYLGTSWERRRWIRAGGLAGGFAFGGIVPKSQAAFVGDRPSDCS